MVKNVIIGCPLLIVLLTSCSGASFEGIGQAISQGMSAAGIAGGADVESLFRAGAKVSSAAGGLSDSDEYYLGRAVAARILGRYSMVRNQGLQSYVQRVGLVVASFSTRPEIYGGYRVGVLDSDEVNALSAPGGFLFLTRGLIRLIPSEDALAAVLAHEVAHVALGHGVGAISHARITKILTELGQEAASRSVGGEIAAPLVAAFSDSIKDVTDALLIDGYSRSQEYDADRYAVELLQRSGYDPMALLDVLRALEAAKGDAPTGGWFATHPAPATRRERLEGQIQPSEGSAIGRVARTARFKRVVAG